MYEVEFMCPDGSELTLEICVENNDDKTIQKAIKPLLFKNYLSLLLKEYTYDDIILLYNRGEEVSKKELRKIVWKQDSPKYECMKIKKVCLACKEGMANQLAHMDFGGCLYDRDMI